MTSVDFLRRPILVIFIFCLSTLGVKKMEGKQIYVAIDGNDEAIGTLEQPFASLHRAITEIRQLHQSQPKTGVTVIIGNGIYPTHEPLTLAAEESGTTEPPIRFVA